MNSYIDIRFSKKPQRLPVVLSRKDIDELIGVTQNQKHRLLLCVAYGAGLRLGEVRSLKVKDLDLYDGVLTGDLSVYIESKELNDPVFESDRGGKLSNRTIQKIFSHSMIKAGITKDATFHSLRHSFATHLLENGTDVRFDHQE